MSIAFADETFDAVVSRNLTWNLEDPEQAYKEWMRVLKKGGILLNYDANWYHHLFDAEKREEYEKDRQMVTEAGLEDHYTCTDIDRWKRLPDRCRSAGSIAPGGIKRYCRNSEQPG